MSHTVSEESGRPEEGVGGDVDFKAHVEKKTILSPRQEYVASAQQVGSSSDKLRTDLPAEHAPWGVASSTAQSALTLALSNLP